MTSIKKYYLFARERMIKVLVRQAPAPPIAGSVSSILVISEPRLGDTALEIPAFREIRSAFPDAVLGIVASAQLHPLLHWACMPNLLLDYSEAKKVCERNWDVAIDMTGDYHLRPAMLAAASRAPVRIGFEYAGRGRFFNIPLSVSCAEHMADRYMRPLRAMGIEENRGQPLTLPSNGGFSVGIHPGAHHPTQRWPSTYYGDLIRSIHAGGRSCVVFGSEAERDLVEEVVRLSGGVATPEINTSGVMDLVERLRSINVLICNNSGPLHLAGLLGVPTLSFMGPTMKQRWWPRHGKAVVLRRDDLSCIGCNLGHCKVGTLACMTEITPAMALEAFLRLADELEE